MKLRIIILLSLYTSLSFGQNEPFFNFFYSNYSLYNPAYSGVNYRHYGAVNHNSRFQGIVGDVYAVSANYDIKINKLNSGFGLGYLYDESLYLVGTHRAYLNYNYQFNTEKGIFSLGISGIFSHKKFPCNVVFDYSWLGYYNYDKQSKLKLNLGAYYKTGNFEAGISSVNINKPYFEKIGYESERLFHFTSAYKFRLFSFLNLKTSGVLITDLNNYSASLNNMFEIYDVFLLGFSIAHRYYYWLDGYNDDVTLKEYNSLCIKTGFNIYKKFRLGVSYHFGLKEKLNAIDIGNDIFLAYMFK